jgi:cytochrome c5
MRLNVLICAFLGILMVAAASGCAKKEEPKPAGPAPLSEAAQDGKILVENMCTVCHSLERVTEREETKEKWEKIIKEMQGKKPGFISDADAAKMLEYLSTVQGK